MFQLISIAMFALIGFSPLAITAAPTHTNAMVMNESPASSAPVAAPAAMPRTFSQHELESIISDSIAQVMDKDTMVMVKRDGDAPFSLDTLFRGIFDNVINYVIEVTPLNDIVHGNYDLLYEFFVSKVQEILTGVAASEGPAPSNEGASPFDQEDKDIGDADSEADEDDDEDENEDDDEDEDDN